MIMFALILEAFYEQLTSRNVRTLWGALEDGHLETHTPTQEGRLEAHLLAGSCYKFLLNTDGFPQGPSP